MRHATVALAIALATPAHAILIRADRDDAEYLALAQRYPSSVLLNAPDGEGVLIARQWVLTAAHMVKALRELKTLPRLAFSGREYEIESMHAHPEWQKGNPFDIGLIKLREAVTGVEPVPIRREKEEGGKIATIVGHGYTGKIGEKATRENWDRKARAATNTVDRVSPRLLGLRIKDPKEASHLQGAAAPGDSGGPLYIEEAGVLRVAGIGYATDDTNADGIVGNAGDWELYVRVSAFAGWIDEVIAGRQP